MDDNQQPHIEQQTNTCTGDGARQNIFNAPVHVHGGSMSNEDILVTFSAVGADIRNWRNVVADGYHIQRDEANTLLGWVRGSAKQPKERVCALLGNAGQGKTVVMRDLLVALEQQAIPTLAIKSDAYVVDSLSDLKSEFGLKVEVVEALRQLNNSCELVVLLIDQIDALSMSLSSNRKPLSTYNRLIMQAAQLEHVRVVLSCRSFDWEYDSILSNFHSFSNSFTLSDLSLARVDDALHRIGESIAQKAPALQNFLCNPLHLYLYCELHDKIEDQDNVTLTDLYSKLWSRVVLNSQFKGEAKDCLGFISNKMYAGQVLHLPKAQVEDVYPEELSYLTSNNFLTCTEGRRPSVQFIHQSLFDYVYARLYIDSGRNLISEIKADHQGLFIRARIKQYFQYLREYDEERYIDELHHILTDQAIRFHIKHLLISWLASFNSPLPSEIALASNIILSTPIFRSTFINAVSTAAWFNFVIASESFKEKIASGDVSPIAECRQMCFRIGYDSTQCLCIVKFLDSLLDMQSEKATEFVANNFDSIRENKLPELKDLFLRVNSKESVIVPYHFLQYHSKFGDTVMVAREIEKYVQKRAEDLTVDTARDFSWNFELEHLWDELKQSNPDEALWVALRNIECVANKTIIERHGEDDPYLHSRVYYLYDGGSSFPDDTEKWVIYARQELENRPVAEIGPFLKFLHDSRQNVAKVILTCAYISHVAQMYDEAFDYFSNLELLNHAEPLTDYYLIHLAGKLYDNGTDDQRRQLVEVIMQINAPTDKGLRTASPNRPITYTGYTRARYLNGIGIDKLKPYNKEAAEELRQMLLKHKGGLVNDRPFKMTMHTGWPGMSQTALDTMSDKDILKAMAGVKTENSFVEDRPSMRGYAMQLQQMAKVDYERFKKILHKAFQNKDIDFLYKYYILSGLMESTDPYPLPSEVSQLYEKLVDEVLTSWPDVEAEYLISAVRRSDFYTKKKLEMPPEIFDFICKVALEYDDSGDHTNDGWGDKDLYQSGINQVRGAAADCLVEYSYREDARGRLVEVFNTIAANGTPTTVSAMLLKLGYFGYFEPKAMTQIYITAIRRDFHPALLHIPLHRFNPVFKALSKEYDLVEPLLKEIVALDEGNEEFSVVLWFGWLWSHESSRDMLFNLLEKSSTARNYWLDYTSRDMPDDAVEEYKQVLDILLSHIDKDLAHNMDHHFDEIDKILPWDAQESVCERFTANPACIEAKHMFLEYIGRQIPEHPVPCLNWLIRLLDYISKEDEQITLSRIIDLMLNAYNALRKYDKDNQAVESAMSKFDDILAKDNCNRNLTSFLYKLDE